MKKKPDIWPKEKPVTKYLKGKQSEHTCLQQRLSGDITNC